jgi:hypothetical protein
MTERVKHIEGENFVYQVLEPANGDGIMEITYSEQVSEQSINHNLDRIALEKAEQDKRLALVLAYKAVHPELFTTENEPENGGENEE